MGTTRIFTSKNRTGPERAGLIPCQGGVEFRARWELVQGAVDAPTVSVAVITEFTPDAGQTFEEVKRTIVSGALPSRGRSGGPIIFTPRADGHVSVTADTRGTMRYAVDLITP